MKGVAISQWCGYFRKWCGYFILVWLFHFGVAIYENGVAISFSVSRAPVGAKNHAMSVIKIKSLGLISPLSPPQNDLNAPK